MAAKTVYSLLIENRLRQIVSSVLSLDSSIDILVDH